MDYIKRVGRVTSTAERKTRLMQFLRLESSLAASATGGTQSGYRDQRDAGRLLTPPHEGEAGEAFALSGVESLYSRSDVLSCVAADRGSHRLHFHLSKLEVHVVFRT